ncbi:hypothetical protein GIB67_005289 [Kingdonia uniflora]|uniref:RING-type domain-containing protein n=1 Tax=Kingdonia uniflora TaxID=39325 RepID=A0A7J7N593_9MAGN|nr:hypothetical protein GIB67_005289 [Kingdonia uniflora]
MSEAELVQAQAQEASRLGLERLRQSESTLSLADLVRWSRNRRNIQQTTCQSPRIQERLDREWDTRILNGLPMFCIDRGGDVCTVCLKEWKVGDEAVKTGVCEHWFHSTCIVPWLRRNNSCPVCRSNVPISS